MLTDNKKQLFIETYGCQMNVNDSEVVAALLASHGYQLCNNLVEADLILVNTCSIRDNAEQRIWGRLAYFRSLKKKNPRLLIGIIGCMAERLKERILERERIVDIVVGPDAYRSLPELIQMAEAGQQAVNVELSREETYAEVEPVRYSSNGVTAFVSIMRGCNNVCSYCVVPYTRGAERSRDPHSIIREVAQLVDQGYKEVTLLGQNVNSYHALIDNQGQQQEVNFATLLEMVAQLSPQLRVRYSTSHPKDMSDQLLHIMAKYPNICKSIHLPAQSGNSRILSLMRRGYSREEYLDRIAAIKRIVPNCTLSTDIIVGFCSETEDEFQDTLSLMTQVGYDSAFMFAYSERPNTKAARTMPDDVPEEVKSRRLTELIDLQNTLSKQSKEQCIGHTVEVLAEGFSKKSDEQLFGRTSQNMVVVFPRAHHQFGDYVQVRITGATSSTLIGELV